MNFIEFAASYGLHIEHLIEGRWQRVRTEKRHKRNGAYKFLGSVGFVQNHATMENVAIWREGGTGQAVDRAAFRAQLRKANLEREDGYRRAAAKAQALLDAATLGVHPYLKCKGFPKETGFVLGKELLLPMRDCVDYRKLNGVQRIDPDGNKLFLTGMRAQGAVFKIGNDYAPERWLCEGYATGLSLRAALADLRRKALVVVCFSDSNMVHVAPKVRQPVRVMADNDVSGAGKRAAEKIGFSWVMPPDEGDDANDHMLKHGLRSLVRLIQQM